MKFFLFLFIFLSIDITASAQVPYYDLKKDKHWIDSLRMIVKWVEENEPATSMKLYFNTNLIIGSYYEKMYRMKKLPDMRKAIGYYRNITGITYFPGSGGYEGLMAQRNNLCRKLSNIYFFGKGIKKNREEALQLAVKGIGHNRELFKKYSRRFYNCECFILNKTQVSDSAFVLMINPFYFRAAGSVDIDDKEMMDIADYLSSYHKPGIGFVLVTGYPEASMAAQSRVARVLDRMKDYFKRNGAIPPDHFFWNLEVGNGNSTTIEINYKIENE